MLAEDKPVRERWKEYYKQLCIHNPDQMQIKQRSEAYFKLLESMSVTLGYGGTINWEDIQNPYIPSGMATAFDNSTTIQSAMAALLPQMLSSMADA